MAQNNSDSARAVQYLDLGRDNNEVPATSQQRPVLNVETELTYSMQRYVNSHVHAEDRVLRPPPHHFAANTTTLPLTVDESRARMAGIISAAASCLLAPAPAPTAAP